MKIFVLSFPLNITKNPYVGTLIESIDRQYGDVKWTCDLLSIWKDDIVTYDIVHIHWPDQLVKWHSADEVAELIHKLKSNNVKIVATCHNYGPHYSSNPEELKAFEIVYENADLMLHLGKESQSVMSGKYSHCSHILLWHHIYDKLFPKLCDKEECRRRLKLRPDGKYVLCFGLFRNDEERKFIADVADALSKESISIIAPSFVRVNKRKNMIAMLKELLKYYKEKFAHRNIIMKRQFIPDDEIPYYYGAVDAAILQRLHILNSGNIPLAFWLKTVVVGPNVGNVGALLQDFGNPTFDANNPMTSISAIKDAIKLATEKRLGQENREKAQKLFSTDIVAAHLYDCYRFILEKHNK